MVIAHIVGAKVWGGGEQYVYDVCKQLQNNGHKNYVFINKEQIMLRDKFAEVAIVVETNLSSLGGVGAYNQVKKYLLEYEISILNCHSGHYALLCALIKKSIPSLCFIMFRHNAQPNKQDIYHAWLRRQFDAVVCVSKLVYDMQIETLEEILKYRWHLVYSGIDTEQFKDMTVDKTNDRIVVGYAGRLVQDKGVEVLLYALAKLTISYPNIILRMAGTGNEKYLFKLKALCDELCIKDKVEFCGHQGNMNKFYRSLDIFVLPSIVKEAFGLAVCEAMYCGVPVITTDNGAQKEIVSDGVSGILIPPDDVSAIVSSVEKLLDNPDFSVQICAAGQEVVSKNFTMQKCVEKLIELYTVNR